MSDPYGYGQQGQGYPPQGGPGGYNNDPYGTQGGQQQQQQGYPPQGQGQSQYGQYGPPHAGGFQHHQDATPQAYDAYNQQSGGGAPHYGQNPNSRQDDGMAYGRDPRAGSDSWGSPPPHAQFPQQGAYNQGTYPDDPNNPYQQQQGPPGAEGQEGDRGLMGALAGGAAGWYGGGKVGSGHSILGALAGAWGGSKLEDKYKDSHNSGSGGSHHHHQSGGSGYGGSSYGGSSGRW